MDTPRTKALARKWSLKEGCTNGTTSPESAELYDLAFDLEAKLSQAEARVAAMEKDAERLDEIASEYLTLEPFSMPTPGGDDADVGWRVTQEHQGKPKPVEVAIIYKDDPRAAIDAAIAALAE